MPTRLLVLLVVLLGGCKGTRPAAQDDAAPPPACETADDCERGWVCLAGRCADPSSTAIYTDPSNAVTPEKMKEHVEQMTGAAEQRNDEAVQGAE